MKIALLSLLFVIACSKEVPELGNSDLNSNEIDISSAVLDSDKNIEEIQISDPLNLDDSEVKELAKFKKNNDKQYMVNFGSFQIEYFADRLLIKAESAGISDKIQKFTYHKSNKLYHRITLGSFDSKEDAEEAVAKMKKHAPELLFKIIEI